MTVIPDRLQLLDRKRLTDGLCDNCARTTGTPVLADEVEAVGT